MPRSSQLHTCFKRFQTTWKNLKESERPKVSQSPAPSGAVLFWKTPCFCEQEVKIILALLEVEWQLDRVNLDYINLNCTEDHALCILLRLQDLQSYEAIIWCLCRQDQTSNVSVFEVVVPLFALGVHSKIKDRKTLKTGNQIWPIWPIRTNPTCFCTCWNVLPTQGTLVKARSGNLLQRIWRFVHPHHQKHLPNTSMMHKRGV